MRLINKHIIHCSDSEYGEVKAIREWHKKRGFRDVGYHFIIRRDGEIEIGRQLSEMGAHCKGHNKNSVGTCLIGKNSFNKCQYKALIKLNNYLKLQFKELEIIAHNSLNKHKTCPNFDIKEIIKC